MAQHPDHYHQSCRRVVSCPYPLDRPGRPEQAVEIKVGSSFPRFVDSFALERELQFRQSRLVDQSDAESGGHGGCSLRSGMGEESSADYIGPGR